MPTQPPPDTPAPDTPSRDAERAEVMEDLIDALRLFTVESDVFVDVFARAHGLGRSDLNAIMWISEGTHSGHPVTAGELASRLGLGAPATTGLVDRLENAGHVRRERDPRDRRKVTIVMQPPALQVAMDFFVPLGRRMHETVADISLADLQRTAAVVRRLITAVTAARTAAASPAGPNRTPVRDTAASGQDSPAAARGHDSPAAARGHDSPAAARGQDSPAAASGQDSPAAANGLDRQPDPPAGA